MESGGGRAGLVPRRGVLSLCLRQAVADCISAKLTCCRSWYGICAGGVGEIELVQSAIGSSCHIGSGRDHIANVIHVWQRQLAQKVK